MIYIVLRAPNGDGTFSPVLGLTTGDTAQTINGVLCVPGCINKGSVSKLSDSMDISQAKGGIPQGIQWSFDLIDWTGAARRSAGLLNGGTRFVGWRAALYISRHGDNSTPSPVCGSADYFAINGCSSADGVVQLKCIAAWALNASLVSFKSGTQSVGLVVGGHAVSVPTEAIEAPDPIEYHGSNADQLYTGNPGNATPYSLLRTNATSKDAYTNFGYAAPGGFVTIPGISYTYSFACASLATYSELYAQIKAAMDGEGCVISGNDLAFNVIGQGVTVLPEIAGSGDYKVTVIVPKIMYDKEEAKDVKLSSCALSGKAICAGSSVLDGFLSDGRLSVPQGSATDDSYILKFTPYNLTPDGGFAAFSVLPAKISFRAGATAPSANVHYFGVVESIATDGTAELFNGYDGNLVPVSPSNFTMYGTLQPGDTARKGMSLYVDLGIMDWTPSRLISDVAMAIVTKNLGNTFPSDSVWKKYPFSSAEDSLTASVAPGVSASEAIALRGPGRFASETEFTDAPALNASGELMLELSSAYSGPFQFNIQVTAATIYGESTLSFGSNYAQVQPGASPWWAAPVTPGEVVAALSGNVSGPVYPSIPDGPLRTPISWGEYIAPDKTYMDAAVKICEEFWITLAETNASKDATGNELLTVPSIDMGSYTDVVTEPVIEYAPVGGAYTKRAYISNVDQAFDASRPGDFYGGWGKSNDQDFGFEIWKICREAYKTTGTKASETYQADGIHGDFFLGLEWLKRTRAGVNRISWLAYPPRYMTFSILDDEAPSWWSGAQVNPPKSMAGFAGYNVPAGAFTVVAKEFDPMTCEASFTVALPPLASTGTTNRIIQTASSANDRIVQSLTATDRIIQISEA